MSVEPEATLVALTGVIREARGPVAIESDPASFLDGLGLSPEDRRHMLACGSKRLLAYQALVHNRMRNTVLEFIPRTAARIGSKAMVDWIRRFVAEHPPRTPYLRDVPSEFLGWVNAHWRADPEIHDFLVDLARYELLDTAMRNAEGEVGTPTNKAIALDAGVVCNGTLEIVRFDWKVYNLPTAETDRSEPDREEPGDALLVIRGPDEKKHERTIKARSAYLVENLMAGLTLQQALISACERASQPLDDEVLKSTALTLADLIDASILLGGA